MSNSVNSKILQFFLIIASKHIFFNSGVASLFKKKQNKVSIFVTKSATLWEIVSVVCLLTSVYTSNQCKTVTIQLKNVRLVPFFGFYSFFRGICRFKHSKILVVDYDT